MKSLFMVFALKSIFSAVNNATLAFFFSFPLAWNILFYLFTFRLCRSFFLWWVSCSSICAGHVFLPTQLPYVPGLEHSIDFYLRLLLIGTYSLPFLLYLCFSLSLLLSLSVSHSLSLSFSFLYQSF